MRCQELLSQHEEFRFGYFSGLGGWKMGKVWMDQLRLPFSLPPVLCSVEIEPRTATFSAETLNLNTVTAHHLVTSERKYWPKFPFIVFADVDSCHQHVGFGRVAILSPMECGIGEHIGAGNSTWTEHDFYCQIFARFETFDLRLGECGCIASASSLGLD